jgi:hypothetical protein
MFNDSRSVYELNIQSCYHGHIHFRKFIFTHSEFPFLEINNKLHTSTHPELNSQNIFHVLREMQIEHSDINDVFIPHKTSCS